MNYLQNKYNTFCRLLKTSLYDDYALQTVVIGRYRAVISKLQWLTITDFTGFGVVWRSTDWESTDLHAVISKQ